MAEWDCAHVAVGEQAEGLRLPLLICEHEQAVELAGCSPVLHTAHVRKAHRKGLQMLGLEVLHAADEQRALRATGLKLGVVRPELITHVVALVEGHLREPTPAELANDGLRRMHAAGDGAGAGASAAAGRTAVASALPGMWGVVRRLLLAIPLGSTATVGRRSRPPWAALPVAVVVPIRLRWHGRLQPRLSAVARLRVDAIGAGRCGIRNVAWVATRLLAGRPRHVVAALLLELLLVLELLELRLLRRKLSLGFLALTHRLGGGSDSGGAFRLHLDCLLVRSRDSPLGLHLL